MAGAAEAIAVLEGVAIMAAAAEATGQGEKKTASWLAFVTVWLACLCFNVVSSGKTGKLICPT